MGYLMWEGGKQKKNRERKDYFKKNYLISVIYSYIIFKI